MDLSEIKQHIADIREDDGMSVMGIGRSVSRVTQIKDARGNVVATIRTSRPSKSSNNSKKKKKPLQYNFKQISSQIMLSKTPANARKVLTKARGKVAELLKKQNSENYDDRELRDAIIHAKKMERIAKKRMKHLQQEEDAKQDKNQSENMEDQELEMEDIFSNDELDEKEVIDDELLKIMQELQALMEESMDDLMDSLTEEAEFNDLVEEVAGIIEEELEPEELERLKKKHRADELREIAEADMKYLRALFDKLEKDKQSSPVNSGVSLELSGEEIPVEVIAEPVMVEGGTIDFSV